MLGEKNVFKIRARRRVVLALLVACVPARGIADDDLAKEMQGAVATMKQEAGLANTGMADGFQPPVGTVVVAATPEAVPEHTNLAAVDILSHVTLTEGIEFPKQEEIIWEPTPTAPPGAQENRVVIPSEEKEYRMPRRCERDETRRVVVDASLPDAQAFYDYLYLPEEFVPVDPEEVFGKGVNLEPVGGESGQAVLVRMKVQHVPCLPYRVRISEAAMYEDFGSNALRNYSSGQAGKGTLDVRMQKKLFGKK